MATPLTPLAILRQAAVVLRARGWNQRGYAGADGAVCLVGALHVASGGMAGGPVPEDNMHAYCAAMDALGVSVGVTVRGLVTVWNDQPGRTVAEVMDLIVRTALRMDTSP